MNRTLAGLLGALAIALPAYAGPAVVGAAQERPYADLLRVIPAAAELPRASDAGRTEPSASIIEVRRRHYRDRRRHDRHDRRAMTVVPNAPCPA